MVRSLLEVLAASLKLGFTSFGGPIAHIGYFRHEYVERRRWLDESTFADLVALTQVLPGPASSQLGIAIATHRAGMLAGIVSWVGFTLPSAIVLALFGVFSVSTDLSAAGWVHGLKLAAVAVVAQAVWAMARSLTPDWPRRGLAIAAAAIALASATPLAQVGIIAGGGLAGWLVIRVPPVAVIAGEASPISRRAGVVALCLFVGLLVGLPILRDLDGHPAALVESFYRTGSLVFGGGHVVLPLLDSSVVDQGWVSEGQFLAGYGAAQAIPGPLFAFAAYLGAVSAIPPNGLLGATIAVIAIFLPGILLTFGTMPFWDLLRRSTQFRRAIAGTNAAVVGILLAALYSPIWTSSVATPIDVFIGGGALAILLTRRAPPILVVALTALAGQIVGAGSP